MTRPHSRNRTDISCSLDARDFALSARVEVNTWSIAEPALVQSENRGQLQLGLTRENLELNLLSVGVFSTPLSTPRIQTVGCVFEQSKVDKVEAKEAKEQVSSNQESHTPR